MENTNTLRIWCQLHMEKHLEVKIVYDFIE